MMQTTDVTYNIKSSHLITTEGFFYIVTNELFTRYFCQISASLDKNSSGA